MAENKKILSMVTLMRADQESNDSPSITRSSKGKTCLEALVSCDCVEDFNAEVKGYCSDDLRPVLSSEAADDLNTSLDESVVVARLTAALELAIEGSGIILSNTENYSWLSPQGTGADLKPDMVALHDMRHQPRSESGDEALKAARNTYGGKFIFGGADKCAGWSDYVGFIVEFKEHLIRKKHEAVGDAMAYCDCPGFKERRLLQLLCGKDTFWLVHCLKGSIVKITKASSWSAPGTLKLLVDAVKDGRNFSPSLNALVWAQDIFKVRGVKPPSEKKNCPKSSWLGRGARGSVFRVREIEMVDGGDAQDYEFALKVVTGEDAGEELESEFKRLRVAREAGCPVVEVVGQIQKSAIGGAYLMRPVGKSVEFKTDSKIKSAFLLLRDLHSREFSHGDARRENIVEGPTGSLLWIDFAESSEKGPRFDVFSGAVRRDLRTLALSILRVKDLPSNIHDITSESDSNPSKGDCVYETVAEMVFSALDLK